MRHFLKVTVLFWMFGVTLVMAQPRSRAELDAIANSVLNESVTRSVVTMAISTTSSQVLNTVSPTSNEAFYVYTPEDGKNNQFVIVSGDKRMPAVLGYSNESSFDAANLPDGLRWFLEKCKADMALLNEHPTASVATSIQTRCTSIAPLLGNRVWDQGKPFNNQCPEVSDGIRTVVGCTATAMAQIMAYHKHPQKVGCSKSP